MSNLCLNGVWPEDEENENKCYKNFKMRHPEYKYMNNSLRGFFIFNDIKLVY